MHFIEDTDSQDKTCLKLWRNTKDEIYFEMAIDGEIDSLHSQFMTLNIEDSKALATEILRILAEIEEDRAVARINADSNGVNVDNNPSDDGINASNNPKPKKKNGIIHGQYVKNDNGQMELMA